MTGDILRRSTQFQKQAERRVCAVQRAAPSTGKKKRKKALHYLMPSARIFQDLLCAWYQIVPAKARSSTEIGHREYSAANPNVYVQRTTIIGEGRSGGGRGEERSLPSVLFVL